VELADGRKLPAALISSDAESDLAILKITGDKPFPTLELGDSSDLLIGEPVITIGNPMGYSHSVSTGIVAAIHRDLKDQQNRVLLTDLVQTDAAINPGNSGGPLLNAYGQVIGVNTAIRGDAQNIGFAIQVNKLRDLIPDLMNPAQVAKIDVGLKLKEVRKTTPPSVVTSQVVTAGDQSIPIVSINGSPVSNIVDAYAALLRIKPTDEKFSYGRPDKEIVELSVHPMPLPDAIVQAKERLGVTIELLTPMLAEKYRISRDEGFFVTAVARDSIAAKAGIQPGDVIFQLGPYRVSRLEDLSVLLPHLPKTGRVRVGVVRDEQVGFGALELQE
jgi:serine protease Do